MAASPLDLEADLRQRLGRRTPTVAAAVVSAGITRVVSIGCPEHAHFEIGSVSKGITGLLYADALERGEIDRESALGEFLPIAHERVAALTLSSLTTHRSGLPRLPRATATFRRSIRLSVRGTNPYGETLAELLEQVRDVKLGPPGARYSNLGFELLGHALAGAAGLSYADLVRERIARPLGLDTIHTPATAAEVRPGAVAGRSRRGRPREPWTGEALAPAGGIRASVTDIGHLIEAVLDGSAPGIAALDPTADSTEGTRIGAAWMVTAVRGHDVTWHNGMTGGCAAWLGMNRAAGTGVVILSATARPVDRVGLSMLLD